MLAVERNTVKFSEFVAGLALFFEPGLSYKREKAIYNFYDFNRQGYLHAARIRYLLLPNSLRVLLWQARSLPTSLRKGSDTPHVSSSCERAARSTAPRQPTPRF